MYVIFIFSTNNNNYITVIIAVMHFDGRKSLYVDNIIQNYIIFSDSDIKRVETGQHLLALPLDDRPDQYEGFVKGGKDAPGKLAALAHIVKYCTMMSNGFAPTGHTPTWDSSLTNTVRIL